MSAFNINGYYGCKHGLLFPVLLINGNQMQYPNCKFKRKDTL